MGARVVRAAAAAVLLSVAVPSTSATPFEPASLQNNGGLASRWLQDDRIEPLFATAAESSQNTAASGTAVGGVNATSEGPPTPAEVHDALNALKNSKLHHRRRRAAVENMTAAGNATSSAAENVAAAAEEVVAEESEAVGTMEIQVPVPKAPVASEQLKEGPPTPAPVHDISKLHHRRRRAAVENMTAVPVASEQLKESPPAPAMDVTKLLVVKTDESLPFSSGTTAVFESGQSFSMFQCGPGASDQVLAEEAGNVQVRSFMLSIAAESGTGLGALVGSLVGGDDDELAGAEVWIVEAKLSVEAAGAQADGLPTLHAGLEKPISRDNSIQVPSAEAIPETLTVLYDCWRDGLAFVELRLKVASSASGNGTDVCFRWSKVCKTGFSDIAIQHDDEVAFPATDGVEPRLMDPEGVIEPVTKLSLTSSGIMRMRPPTVSSQQKFLTVELRGPYFGGADDSPSFEVDSNPVEFSVLYTCESDGLADIILTFEQSVLSTAHRPESMQIHWRKLCGSIPYKHLEVNIKSELNGTKTKAVSGGLALPGFMRPCPPAVGLGNSNLLRTTTPVAAPEDQAARHPDAGALCGSTMPILEVHPKDSRTVLELNVRVVSAAGTSDRSGGITPPSYQPEPDLSYDRKILRAHIVHFPQNVGGSQRKGGTTQVTPQRLLNQQLIIKYTCLKDGVSTIMVTLHVLGHKPIDLAWRKRCLEPKVKVGKALTAPQAMLFAFLACGLIGLVICMVFLLCSSNDKEKRNLFQMNGNTKGSDAKFTQMTSSEPGPSMLGSVAGENEVTYH